MDHQMRYLIGLCILGLLTSCLVGCGGESGAASAYGSVTLDDEPVEKGTISFVPVQGSESKTVTTTIEDGDYEIEERSIAGLKVETYQVKISWKKTTGEQYRDDMTGTMLDAFAEAVPPKFNIQSELQGKIEEGSNKLDFELKTSG